MKPISASGVSSAFPQLILILATSFVMTVFPDNSIAQENDDIILQTVAESSEFQSTATSAEVVEFIDTCAAKPHVNRHVFGQTVEGRDMVAAIVSSKPYSPGDQTEKRIALILGNIHSGECCGKEAILMMLRELANDPDHPWLEKMVIVLVPNYNADANDRMGPNNRRGQAGPVNGMGRRENAQQLDLNRDFGKLDSPEARSLVGLINTCNPDLFVDCHTTNGSKHQYALTYAIPVNPAASRPLRDFMRNRMMPEITKQMAAKNWFTFYYGNFNEEHDRWATYGMEPRYSTDYVGMRGRLSVLSEAYAYISFEDRIKVTKDFVTSLLDYVAENDQAVKELLEIVEQDLVDSARTQPGRISIPLDSKLVEFQETFTLKGYKDDQPHDFECKFLGDYKPTTTVQLPYAYLVPEEMSRIAERLSLHGAMIEQLDEETGLNVQRETITKLVREERAFQKHNMVRAETNRIDKEMNVPAGTYVVRTAQPLGRLIALMLEPMSNDGFIVWNFFDEYIHEGSAFPVLRIAEPVEIKTSATTEFEPRATITLDMIDGPNAILPKTDAPSWHGETNMYESETRGRKLLVDAASDSFVGTAAPPTDKTEISALLVNVAGLDESTAGKVADVEPKLSADNAAGTYTADGVTYLIRFSDNAAIELGSKENPAELLTYNSQSTRISFFTRSGLHVVDLSADKLESGEPLLVAKDENHLVGKLDWVYQEELYGRGNFQGHWWSSDGDHLAYMELDETELIPFIVMDHIPVRGESEKTNYPKAGDPLPKVRIGVADVTSGKMTWIELGEYDDSEILVSRVTWSGDGQHLYLQVQNREQTWLDLIRTNVDGGSPEKLFRDSTPAWIESPGDPQFLLDSSFLWVSPRNGFKHIYHYEADGTLRKQITAGDWEVRSLDGVSGNTAFIHATRDSAVNVQGYKLDLDSGEMTQLTEGEGMHSMNFSHDMSYFIDRVSTATMPPGYSVYRSDGTRLRLLNQDCNDRLSYLNVSEPEFIEVPTGDGEQPMDAMLITPPDFDPAKKYPVLVFIYGGPQTPRVRNSFGGEWYLWHQMLAQKGYVIWMCDGRSSSYRSAKNVWPIYRNFAENELADIETGIEWLKQKPWVDSNRLGIWGWSYGGYMTAYALCHSETFKMGISGAPVTDWKNYDAIYTERYMDLPKNNPEGYEQTSLLPVAQDLHGKMLLIHGEIDDNVHINNTMQLVYELQKHNKQFDLMIYPGARHSVKDDGQQAHLRKLMTEFVLENL